METHSNTPISNLNFRYQALDNFLSTEFAPGEFDKMLEEVEVELLSSPVDVATDELDLDVNKIDQLFYLLRELQPAKS